MFNIFLRTIKERKWTVLIYCIGVLLFLWMYIALFPTFKGQMANLEQYMKAFPESFMKAFGFEIQYFGTLEGYLASEQFSFIWPIMLIALMVSMGSSFLAGEIEKGTIAILLSQPISRIKIFLSKYLTGFFYLIIFTTVSIISIFPLARAYDITYNTERFCKLGLVSFLFGLAIFSLSMLFSALFSEKSKPTFIVVGILLVMYFINIVSGLKENLDKLKYFSFFYYFKPPEVLNHNVIDKWTWWVFLGTFVISTILALIWFKKKDIAI
jgi:ABC-2 type transport system permease protein